MPRPKNLFDFPKQRWVQWATFLQQAPKLATPKLRAWSLTTRQKNQIPLPKFYHIQNYLCHWHRHAQQQQQRQEMNELAEDSGVPSEFGIGTISDSYLTLFEQAASPNVSNLFLKSILEEKYFAFLIHLDFVMQRQPRAASQSYPTYHNTALTPLIGTDVDWCEIICIYLGVIFSSSKSSTKAPIWWLSCAIGSVNLKNVSLSDHPNMIWQFFAKNMLLTKLVAYSFNFQWFPKGNNRWLHWLHPHNHAIAVHGAIGEVGLSDNVQRPPAEIEPNRFP